MPEQLEWPELMWRQGAHFPALEISLDFIPEQYEGKWQDVVRGFVVDWIERKSFEKKGTLWMWGTISVNLISRHPKHPMPSWSEFVIAIGFSKTFLPELATYVRAKFDDQAGITEELATDREAGWRAFCHVEQGSVWHPVDGDMTWERVQPTSPKTTSRKRRR